MTASFPRPTSRIDVARPAHVLQHHRHRERQQQEAGRRNRGVEFAHDSPLDGDGFELPVPRKLGLRRGRRLALHLGSLNAPAARPRLERDQAAPGFGEEGEHCRRVIKRRATASKARPELGALLGLKAVRFGASNAVL